MSRRARASLLFCVAVVLAGCPKDTTTTTTTTTTSTSTPSTTTLPADTTPPTKPATLGATPAGCSRIDLAWSAATDAGGSGLRGYNVYRNGAFVKLVNAPATSTSDTGLAASTAYSYVVRAVDNAGNLSAPSPTATANTPACPDTTPPTAPGGFGAAANGCAQVDLAWTAASDAGGSGLRGYNVYRNGTFVKLVNAPATSTSDAGLAPSTSYAYTARSVDHAGNLSAQSSAAATTPACAGMDLVGFVPGVGTPFDVVVDDAAEIAFVASGEFGLSVVDVSDPADPLVVGAANPPFYGQRVAVDGALAVVGGRSLGMKVVDLTSLDAPHTVGELAGDIGALALVGQTAYALLTVPGNPARVELIVVSLAVPSAPAVVGRVALGMSGSDLAIVGSLAYVAAGGLGLQVVNVANPTAPAVIGGLDTPGTASDVVVAGAYAYVADGAAVRVVNVANPSQPAQVGMLATSASSLALAGTRLTAVDGMQMKGIDVSAPAAPVLLGSASAYGAMRHDVRGTVAFLASANMSPSQGGLYACEVSSPGAPTVLANVRDAFDNRGIAVAGSRAVTAGATAGMKVTDLGGPGAPEVVGALAGTVTAVELSGQTAYVLLLVPGNPSHVDLAVVNVSGAPAIVGRFTLATGGSVAGADLELVGSLLYVAGSVAKLHVVSVASPTAPTLVGMVDLPGAASAVEVGGGHAYVAAGTSVQVVEVLTPSQPRVVGSVATGAAALALAGNRLYGVDGMQLKVIDVTTPAAPSLLAATAGYGAFGVAASGTTVYLATPGNGHGDPTTGIRALDVSNPSAPQLVERLAVPGKARALTIAGGVLYAADGSSIVAVVAVAP